MSGGGGSKTTSTEPWSGQKPALENIYQNADEALLQKVTPRQYGEIQPGDRAYYTKKTTGINPYDTAAVSRLGLDPNATRTAVQSGGFVPFTDAEQEAQGGALALARSGVDPSLLAAQGQLDNNQGLAQLGEANPALGLLQGGAEGDYLTADNNPYLADAIAAAQDPLIERFQADILPSVTSQFGRSGRFGSGAHQYAVERATDDFTQNLADAATGAYANNYAQERGNQLASQQALGSLALGQNQALSDATLRNAALAPTLAGATRQQQLSNLGLLEGVGGAQGEKALQLGTMQAGDFDARANDPVTRLQQYAALVQGTPILPNQTTSGGTNRAAGALGGAATGAALGTAFAPGFGTAIGAGIGGLGGLFL